MEETKHKIELKHEAIEELLGTPPSWLTRWGITIFFGVIVVLLIGCYFFKYPEVATAPIVITTEQPVSWIIAKSNGKIDSMYVNDKQEVKQNDIIALLHNPASWSDLLSLKQLLSLDELTAEELMRRSVNPPQYRLGELQDAYTFMIKCANEYYLFKKEMIYPKRIEYTTQELKEQTLYFETLKQQLKLHETNFRLAQKQFNRDSTLFTKGVFTDVEYERVQQQHLSAKLTLSQSQLALNNAKVNISRLQQTINDYQSEFNNQQSQLNTQLMGAIDKMKSAIDFWEQSYLLKAPMDGVASFSNYWSANQTVTQGERVFAIISKTPGKMIGKCILPMAGAGRVEENQNVNIKLDGYPYMEFGMLQGKVKSISLVPADITTQEGAMRYYTVEINLTNGLTTSYKKKIEGATEISGIAEISTKELSLLEHFVSPLKYLWTKMK